MQTPSPLSRRRPRAGTTPTRSRRWTQCPGGGVPFRGPGSGRRPGCAHGAHGAGHLNLRAKLNLNVIKRPPPGVSLSDPHRRES